MDHIHGQSFDDDRLLEAVNEHSEWDSARSTFIDLRTGNPVRPLSPDHTVVLNGLDEPRILSWWRKFNVPGRNWSTIGQNCATTVGRGLVVGSADDYALGMSGWWHSWNTVWQPNDVLRYAQEVSRGLAVKSGQTSAINFVRRYCESPLGFTSITSSMDEDGLAKAIYNELGNDSNLVRDVFQELNERRNTDADDVAEIYVGLIQRKKGPALSAVKGNRPLRQLLIKILDEGWTSSGEKECINFLKSLK